jgi:hypothetical protein
MSPYCHAHFIRGLQLLLSALLGGTIGTAACFFALQRAGHPIWFSLTRTEGLILVANFFWLVGIPHLLAACVGTSVAKGFRPVGYRFVLGGIAVGTAAGSLLSYVIWTRVTMGIQGVNPILIAGFFIAAFVGPAAMIGFSKQGGGADK